MLSGGNEESVQYAGILGIVVVLGLGLVVLVPIKDPKRARECALEHDGVAQP